MSALVQSRRYGFPLRCGGHRFLQVGPSDFVAEEVPGRMGFNAFLIWGSKFLWPLGMQRER